VFVALVTWLRPSLRQHPGALFFCYIGLYSIGRFAIEALRLDSFWLGSFRVPQVAERARRDRRRDRPRVDAATLLAGAGELSPAVGDARSSRSVRTSGASRLNAAPACACRGSSSPTSR